MAIRTIKEERRALQRQFILEQLAKGRTTKEIGEILKLSSRTIEAHVIQLKNMYGARNVVHLVFLTTKLRLLDNI